jgi:hypothetical protein
MPRLQDGSIRGQISYFILFERNLIRDLFRFALQLNSPRHLPTTERYADTSSSLPISYIPFLTTSRTRMERMYVPYSHPIYHHHFPCYPSILAHSPNPSQLAFSSHRPNSRTDRTSRSSSPRPPQNRPPSSRPIDRSLRQRFNRLDVYGSSKSLRSHTHHRRRLGPI